MYTQCPHCHALFKISATELKAAGGQVRCGACREVFDALRSLSENHSTGTTPATPVTGVGDTLVNDRTEPAPTDTQLPHFSAQDWGQDTTAPSPVLPIPSSEDGSAAPQKTAWATHLEADHADEEIQSTSITALGSSSTVPSAPLVTSASDRDFFTELQHQRTRVGLPIAGFLGLTALTVLLLIQGLYYFRNDLANHAYLRPVTEQLCATLGCTLPLRREPTLISPVSRNIRIHPSHPGALLIETSFINNAGFTQPYPLLGLSFYNLQGQQIANRTFSPEEYLKPGQARSSDIKPQQQVTITLEIFDPGKDAVSFEFDFY